MKNKYLSYIAIALAVSSVSIAAVASISSVSTQSKSLQSTIQSIEPLQLNETGTKQNPWPSNVEKAFKYRQDVYQALSGSTRVQYEKIKDDYPNVITFLVKDKADWKSLNDTQLSISDVFPSRDKAEAAYSLSVIQSRFEDQGFELVSTRKLRDTDTSVIGVNQHNLKETDLDRVVELVMEQRVPDKSGEAKGYATVIVTLLPEAENNELFFSSVGIFYAENQNKLSKR